MRPEVLAMLGGLAACGGWRGGLLSSDASVAGLSAAERVELCEAVATDDVEEITCGPEAFRIIVATGWDLATCEEELARLPPDCPVTVGDLDRCLAALGRLTPAACAFGDLFPAACNALSSPTCVAG